MRFCHFAKIHRYLRRKSRFLLEKIGIKIINILVKKIKIGIKINIKINNRKVKNILEDNLEDNYYNKKKG